jgi:PrcB C-terminal
VVLAVVLLPEGRSRPVGWRDLSAQVGPLRTVDSVRRLFRTQGQLARYLDQAGAERGAPAVDFSTRQLLLVAPGPRSSTGYSVEVVSVTERDKKIAVKVRERTPKLSDRVEARVTYPYRLLSLPAGEDVYVDWVGR